MSERLEGKVDTLITTTAEIQAGMKYILKSLEKGTLRLDDLEKAQLTCPARLAHQSEEIVNSGKKKRWDLPLVAASTLAAGIASAAAVYTAFAGGP